MLKKVILFQCIGILVDGQRMRHVFRENMAQLMSARYGKSPDVWRTADEHIVAHWADYHADLNFSGEEGIDDIQESLFRVTRALFTITGVPEPPKPEITALGNELIAIPCQDVLLPDILPVIARCREKGYAVGTFSYLLEKQTRAITFEIPALEHVIGADTLNHYEHDSMYFSKLCIHLRTSPDKIVIIATSSQTLSTAEESGMTAIPVRQSPAFLQHTLTHFLEK